MSRIKISDLAPNGITGGMVAITKEEVNGRNEFDVVSVDFQHDLIALDDMDDIEYPTWYRTEEIVSIISKR